MRCSIFCAISIRPVLQRLEYEAREHLVPLVARLNARSRPAAGEVIGVAIEPDHLRFDLEDGHAIA